MVLWRHCLRESRFADGRVVSVVGISNVYYPESPMISPSSRIVARANPLSLHVLSYLVAAGLLVYLIMYLADTLPPERGASDLITKELLTRYQPHARPERLERDVFTLSVVASVGICVLSIPLSGVMLAFFRWCSVERFVSPILSLVVILAPPSVLYFSLSMVQGYFHRPPEHLFVSVLWIPLGVGILFASGLLIISRFFSQRHSLFGILSFFATYIRPVLVCVVALACMTISSVWRIFGPGSITGSGVFTQHLNAVIFPQGQVSAGRTIFADFPSQYGAFAELLTPWFDLIGLSVLSFTATLSALVAASIGCILVFVRRYVSSVSIFLVGAASIVIPCSVWYTVIYGFEPYFQYSPIRLLCPALALLIIDRGPWRPDPGLSRRWSFLIGVFCAFSVAWNVDSGVVVLGTWVALQALELSQVKLWLKPDSTLRRERGLRIANVGLFLAGIVVFALLFQFKMYWQSGQWPQWSSFIHYQAAFYYSGFFMLPMPREVHFWMLLVAIYLAGLILGIGRSRGYLSHDGFRPLAMLSILGIGLFSYYQGRSHDHNLVWVSWPAILILLILAQVALDLYRIGTLRLLPALSFVGCVMGAGTISLFFVVRGIPSVERITRAHIHELRNPITPLPNNISYVSGALQGRKDCAVLAEHQAIYEVELQLPSRWRGPGLQGVLFKSEIDVINDQLLTNPPEDLFVGSYGLMGSSSDKESIHVEEVLARNYYLVGESGDRSLKHYKRKDNTWARNSSTTAVVP